MASKKTDAQFVERFWTLVDQRGSCWLWRGAFTVKGYGVFNGRAHGQTFCRAHRYCWAVHNRRPVPKRMMVLHHCDNRWCVNPDHLYLGDNMTNVKDRDRRGRVAHGENHYKAKLTEANARYILESSERPVKLAKRFGVHPTAIIAVRSGKNWARLQRQ